MSIIIFLIILAVLILVHEFGHFIVAKKSGIRVDEFGLGFPPTLFSKKFGSTLYTLNMIPFGGFVKIFGEDLEDVALDPESDEGRKSRNESFKYKPKWIQSLVLVAGVTMNVIFAWLLISLGFMIGLPSPVEHSGFGEVKNVHLVVTEVLVNSPAQKSGLTSGDTILSATSGKIVLGGDTLTPENFQHMVSEGNTKEIGISYTHGTETEVKNIVVEPNTTTVEGRRAIGVSLDTLGTLKLPAHLALLEGARTTWLLLQNTAVGLIGFLWNVVTFNSDFSQVSGPIGIANVVGEAQTLGFVYLLSITALISINLAVINLIPFPALDGGRLFFVIIEAIIRRPIPQRFVRWTNMIGFGFLLLLMAVITVHDILKLF